MRTKRHWERILTVAAGAWLLFATPAKAQPRDNPIERARHHMELGQQAYGQGRFEEAAAEFIDAFAASPFSAFLYNAALSYEKGRMSAKAADFYRRYLEAEPSAQDQAQVEIKIRALLTEAETPAEQVAPETAEAAAAGGVEMKSLISVRTNPADAVVRILDASGAEVSRSTGPAARTVVRGMYTIEASHPDFRTVQTDIRVTPGQVIIVVVEMSQGAFLGFLHVTTNVPAASVYVDDTSAGSVGTTPWGNVLPTGSHKIWIEKPGYEPVAKDVSIELGKQQELSIQLERLAFGTLLVKANVQGAQVFVDGKLQGVAPHEARLTPGEHRVLVQAEDMKDYETIAKTAAGQRTKLLVRMNAKPKRASAWVSASAAALLLGGGGVAGGVALKKRSELMDLRDDGLLASDDPRIKKSFFWGLGADISFGLGAIVGGLSIYYFLRDPLPPSEGKLVAPVDFEENPADKRVGKPAATPASTKQTPAGASAAPSPGKAPADKAQEPPASVPSSSNTPRVLVVPVAGSDGAGLGVRVVF